MNASTVYNPTDVTTSVSRMAGSGGGGGIGGLGGFGPLLNQVAARRAWEQEQAAAERAAAQKAAQEQQEWERMMAERQMAMQADQQRQAERAARQAQADPNARLKEGLEARQIEQQMREMGPLPVEQRMSAHGLVDYVDPTKLSAAQRQAGEGGVYGRPEDRMTRGAYAKAGGGFGVKYM